MSMNESVYKNPIVWSGLSHRVYRDDLEVKAEHINIRNLEPLMDVGLWINASGAAAKTPEERDRAASSYQDLSLVDAFFGPMEEKAIKVFGGIANARKKQDRDMAFSIVTSQDFKTLQNTIVLGESQEVFKTGILASVFEEIQVPNLAGDWADFSSGATFHTNVPEGKSVRPSKGAAAVVPITVSKNMGAVGITEMAEAVINGAPVFSRMVTALGNARLKKENAMWAEEIERATIVQSGVDFGLRSGTPPLSSNVPKPVFDTLRDYIDAAGGTFNTVISKTQPFSEYEDNDTIKGVYTPYGPGVTNESKGPAPRLDGVTWVRDNAIVLGTKLWGLDADKAAKGFRYITRSYQVVKVEEETTIQYLKAYFTPKIVDQDMIVEVTGVTA